MIYRISSSSNIWWLASVSIPIQSLVMHSKLHYRRGRYQVEAIMGLDIDIQCHLHSCIVSSFFF